MADVEEKETLTGTKEGGYGAADDGGESGDAEGAMGKQSEGGDATPTAKLVGQGKFATKGKSSAWFW
jgi:hypothetical protein